MAKNNKDFKSSLIGSFFVMLLSGAMLCGTTFAWFSETVQSQNNQIQAGTLQVDLLKKNGENYESVTDPIFSVTNWTPGDTEIVYLAVQNTGTLEMKYSIEIKLTETGLADVLDYAILDKVQYDATVSLTWENITSKENVQKGNVKESLNASNTITAAENGKLQANGFDYFVLAIHMDDYAPLKYMGKSVTFSINVEAVQATATTVEGNTNA